MKIDLISDINKENHYILDYDRVDKFMVKWAWWSTLFLAIYSFGVYYFTPASFYPSPFSWRVISLTEVLWMLILGIALPLPITLLRGRFRNHYLYRILVTITQTVFAYLIVFISGGSIEWHFYFFVVFALMVMYSDWRLGWFSIIAVALHHGILNYIAPTWVYFYGRNDSAFLSHALLVLLMAIVTTQLCEHNRRLGDAARILSKELKN